MYFADQIAAVLNAIRTDIFDRSRNRWVLLLSSKNSSLTPAELIESTPKPRGRRKLSIDPAKPGQAIGLAKRDKVLAVRQLPAAPAPEPESRPKKRRMG